MLALFERPTEAEILALNFEETSRPKARDGQR